MVARPITLKIFAPDEDGNAYPTHIEDIESTMLAFVPDSSGPVDTEILHLEHPPQLAQSAAVAMVTFMFLGQVPNNLTADIPYPPLWAATLAALTADYPGLSSGREYAQAA
ncbi:uncharacterized protein RHO25_013144 [Cercospora beticola]|uniref:Phage gp6-like head-tail connector protein n=1 Tax=Cercospora beticola TaxID=122368 RepID=A0ABZ0P9H6_CERBT|nr:hypothetical protein RHO25_013144 [Cercospora beticola]